MAATVASLALSLQLLATHVPVVLMVAALPFVVVVVLVLSVLLILAVVLLPTLCSRPYVYFAKQGQCPTGEACGYCHHHHSSAGKPDKQQRELLKRMPRLGVP